MHNLRTVMRFEIIRTLKKKAFWIMAFGFPVMISFIFGIVIMSNVSTEQAAKDLEKQKFSIQVTDDSHLIKSELLTAFGGTSATSKSAAIDAVKSGSLDAYFYYPANLTDGQIEVYAKDVGIFDNGRYTGVAKALLSASVESSVDANTKTIVRDSTKGKVITYRNGVEFDPAQQMILPGLFLVLFYLLIAFFGNQMLTSTTEEKENRVIEMLLTTVEARTLIIGKIYSLIILAMVQGMIIIVPAITGYFLFRDRLNLPDLDLSSLPVDPLRIAAAAVIFIASFLLFTGIMVAIGAAVPTAKEASGFIGIIMMLIFGPLYAVSLFISAPDSPLVRFLTLFPFTAPIPMLLRNAVGNLELWETLAGILILIVSAIVIMLIAVRIFRYGALEYTRKLSLREIFGRS
ncbi:MAG TPA: ABC transporter permease [Candidatus Saccharimonas sp.]|nr:ABC transporter permease [Candidatus Saccharimonas sp.]